jgi:hypothetical protein
MTTKATQSAAACLATASHQMMLDTLMAEMGALRAILPGHAQQPVAAVSADAERRAHEAELDAMFDNMPV